MVGLISIPPTPSVGDAWVPAVAVAVALAGTILAATVGREATGWSAEHRRERRRETVAGSA